MANLSSLFATDVAVSAAAGSAVVSAIALYVQHILKSRVDQKIYDFREMKNNCRASCREYAKECRIYWCAGAHDQPKAEIIFTDLFPTFQTEADALTGYISAHRRLNRKSQHFKNTIASLIEAASPVSGITAADWKRKQSGKLEAITKAQRDVTAALNDIYHYRSWL